MNAATFFADRLSRERELTPEETERLCRSLTPNGAKRMWTAAEDRQMARLKRKGLSAPQIAETMGRTAWSVRCRLHRGRKQQNTVDMQNA